MQQVAFQAEVKSVAQGKLQTVYVIVGQLWQAGRKLAHCCDPAGTSRDCSNRFRPTITFRLNAHAEIAQALKAGCETAQARGIRAHWCFDCHVLELAFHRPDVAAVLTTNYEVVHVDVGQYDRNLDIMQQYEVPKARGIPAIAVLDGDGKLLYSQKGGEFEKARSLGPEDLVAFLNKWKPS